MPVLYRSPVTRWTLAIAGVWAGATLMFGDPAKWQSAPSLDWLKQARIPLEVWGALFVIYAVMLLSARFRALGFAVGAVVWGVFAVSLIATVATAGPKSAPAIAGLVDLAVFHGYAVKTALAANDAERAAQ